MTATNHAITGAIIAVVIDKPVIALPLALLSHFAQDALPHFGYAGHGGYREGLKHRSLKYVMLADLLSFIPFLAILLVHNASIWVYLAAFLSKKTLAGTGSVKPRPLSSGAKGLGE
jgi:hypothetical protein